MPDTSPKHLCANCSVTMIANATRYGTVWFCSLCQSEAVPVELLQKNSDSLIVKQIWEAAKCENHVGTKKCENCRHLMLTTTLGAKLGNLQLDLCATCFLVWFDKTELEKFLRYLKAKTTTEDFLPNKDQSDYQDTPPHSAMEKLIEGCVLGSEYSLHGQETRGLLSLLGLK